MYKTNICQLNCSYVVHGFKRHSYALLFWPRLATRKFWVELEVCGHPVLHEDHPAHALLAPKPCEGPVLLPHPVQGLREDELLIGLIDPPDVGCCWG